MGRDDGDFVIRTGNGVAAGDGNGNGEIRAGTLLLALGLGRFMPRRLGLADEERFEGKGLAYRLPPIDEIQADELDAVLTPLTARLRRGGRGPRGDVQAGRHAVHRTP